MILRPKSRAEEIALFRSEIVGALVRRDLSRGELKRELEALSLVRFCYDAGWLIGARAGWLMRIGGDGPAPVEQPRAGRQKSSSSGDGGGGVG
jgi:hypothetical protein